MSRLAPSAVIVTLPTGATTVGAPCTSTGNVSTVCALSSSCAVTVTVVLPRAAPVTCRRFMPLPPTAAVATLSRADAALKLSSPPSGSLKWAVKSTASVVEPSSTSVSPLTSASTRVTTGADFTVTSKVSAATFRSGSAAFTVTVTGPSSFASGAAARRPVTVSVPAALSTTTEAAPGSVEVAS